MSEMNYIIFMALFICLAYILLLIFTQKYKIDPFGLDATYTLKGIAIVLVILNHLGGRTGSTLFTPLGG